MPDVDNKKHTQQTIEFENGIYVEVDENGTTRFCKDDGGKEIVLFESTVEEVNRINRIMYSGRILPEGYDRNNQNYRNNQRGYQGSSNRS